jgi:hypothetical protein
MEEERGCSSSGLFYGAPEVEGEACRDTGRKQRECGSKLGSFYCGKPGGLLRLGKGNFRGYGYKVFG